MVPATPMAIAHCPGASAAVSKTVWSGPSWTARTWSSSTAPRETHSQRLRKVCRPSALARSSRALNTLNSWNSTNVVKVMLSACSVG